MNIRSQTSLSKLQMEQLTKDLLSSLWVTSIEELVAMQSAIEKQQQLLTNQALGKNGLISAVSAAKAVLPQERLSSFSNVRPGGFLGCLVEPQLLDDFKQHGRIRPVQAKPAQLFEAKLPATVRLFDKMPPVRDQGQRGTCVAFGTVALREFLVGKNIDLSEQFLYWACKELDGQPGPGTYIHTAMTALAEYGVCEEPIWPYNPNQLENEGQGPPPENCSEKAKKYILSSTRTVEPNLVIHYKNVLAGHKDEKGMPITFATLVFDSWYMSTETHRTGKITMPLPGEQPVGGHAWCIVGYVDDIEAPGGGYFIVRNSWGTKWAVDSPESPGHALMPYGYVERYAMEAFTGPLKIESSLEQEEDSDYAGYIRKLSNPERDIEFKLLPVDTCVLCNKTLSPGEFKEDTPCNRQKFRELGFGWTEKTRQQVFFTSPTSFSIALKTQIEQAKAAKEQFSSAIHANMSAVKGRPFPQPNVTFYYHLIPFEWEPKIQDAKEVANLTPLFIEHLKQQSGSPDGLPWPDDLNDVIMAMNDVRVYCLQRSATAIHIVAAFVTSMIFEKGKEPTLKAPDYSSIDAIQRVYTDWQTSSKDVNKPVFVFFTVGSALELSEEMLPISKGNQWIILSYPKKDWNWETRVPRRVGDRLSIRYFVDDLKPEIGPQRASKIRESVDNLIAEFDGSITVGLVAKKTGYRQSLVSDAFYTLQEIASDKYRLYRVNGELAIRKAKQGEKINIRALAYWRVSIRKHLLGILGVGIGFAAWQIIKIIPSIPNFIGPFLTILFGYIGGQIQKFINQHASQGKE
jgi:hypothetical protein